MGIAKHVATTLREMVTKIMGILIHIQKLREKAFLMMKYAYVNLVSMDLVNKKNKYNIWCIKNKRSI